MEGKTKQRLAWVALALFVVVILLMQGCSMLEDQMNTMKELVGMAPDKDIILCEGVECVEAPAASETNTTE